MEIGPILRAMTRNKVGAVLIALQIAFTMTVIVNAYVVIESRLQTIARPTGLVEDELFFLQSVGFGSNFNERVTIAEDLERLRKTPGVVNAAQVNSVPLSQSGWGMGLQHKAGRDPSGVDAAVYMTDEQGLTTFGLKLIAGEDFRADDVQWRDRASTAWPNKTIISRAMAEALFPDDPLSAVGKTVYIADTQPMVISGVVERLQAPWPEAPNVERAIMVPQRLEYGAALYMIRTSAAERDAMMPVIEAQLAESHRSSRIVRNVTSFKEVRERSYRIDSGLTVVLTAVMAVLLLITALGIVGLASFSVNRRTKQIGTRRALGATQSDILRYFLVENFLITSMGVVLGGVMTVAFNMWLVNAMNFPKVQWWYVPLGMAVLWLIGLAAVYGPALRACAVPPAVATRTV